MTEEFGPNVVLCQCDQLRSFAVGCYGNSIVQTPHIDRLAAQGMRFDLAATNNPVCTPARACLLSGQYSRTCAGTSDNEFTDPPAQKRTRMRDTTVAEAFRAAGYDTALIGKWHTWGHPNLVGFDTALYPSVPHRHYGQRYFENFDTDGFVVEEFGPEFEIARVRDYLRGRRDDPQRPFFLHYDISQPHAPVGPGNAPDWYNGMYRPEDVPLRDNVFSDGVMAHSERWFKIYTIWDYFTRWMEKPTDRLPEGMTLRHLIAWYYGLVTMVDDMIGRLAASLEAFGLADNTVVVFLSDHGDNLGSHGLFNKQCLYEESIRIPMIMRLPGTIGPAVNTTQVAQTIDIMPTLLDLCGLPVPDHVQGRSLVPVLTGASDNLDDTAAVIETDAIFFGRPCVGLRTPTHLYGMKLSADGRQVEDDAAWFFDLREDPFEMNNLAQTENDSAVARALRQRLRDWHAATPWLEDGGPAGPKREPPFLDR